MKTQNHSVRRALTGKESLPRTSKQDKTDCNNWEQCAGCTECLSPDALAHREALQERLRILRSAVLAEQTANNLWQRAKRELRRAKRKAQRAQTRARANSEEYVRIRRLLQLACSHRFGNNPVNTYCLVCGQVNLVYNVPQEVGESESSELSGQ